MNARLAAMTLEQRKEWAHHLDGCFACVLPSLDPVGRRLGVLQAALESGYGTAPAAVSAHNLFNLTAGADGSKALEAYLRMGGRVWREENADWEYAPPGADQPGPGWQFDARLKRWRRRIPQNWRAYLSRNECLADWWRWMRRSDYQPAALPALLAGDLEAWCLELHRLSFFTLPAPEYLAKLRAVELEIA